MSEILDRARRLFPRVPQVMAQLQSVSEAPASRALDEAQRGGRGRGGGSPPPPGFDLEDGVAEETLLRKHVAALADVLDVVELWLVEAQFDHDSVRFQALERTHGRETLQEWGDRIVDQWEGWHYDHVRRVEDRSPTLVRNERKKRGREPIYGRRVTAEPGHLP